MTEEHVDRTARRGAPTLLCLGVSRRSADLALLEDRPLGRSRSESEEILVQEREALALAGGLCTVEPAIRELRRWSEEVRASELERLRRSLGDLDAASWDAVEEFSRALTDKLLLRPTTRLLRSVASGSTEEHLEALRRLFDTELRRRRDTASA